MPFFLVGGVAEEKPPKIVQGKEEPSTLRAVQRRTVRRGRRVLTQPWTILDGFSVEATVGIEPTHSGFADRRVNQLRHVAKKWDFLVRRI